MSALVPCSPVPGQPAFLKVVQIDRDTATVSWGLPQTPNGNLTGYVLQYQMSTHAHRGVAGARLSLVLVEGLGHRAEGPMTAVCGRHFPTARRPQAGSEEPPAAACSYKEKGYWNAAKRIRLHVAVTVAEWSGRDRDCMGHTG